MKILIVEDEQRLGAFLAKGLGERAYAVQWAQTCAQASDLLAESSYDVIVLDLGLPDGDGLDLLCRWRHSGFNEPVLILSARNTLKDRVEGLDLGADDYLPKPFGFEELLSRIRSLVRRQAAIKRAVLEHAGIRLDLIEHSVQVENESVDLTSREFALLELLMHNAGRIVTRSYIYEHIWPGLVDTNLLDVYMSRLRTKLDGHRGQKRFKTIRGVGYRME